MDAQRFPHNFTFRCFEYNNSIYKICITPELNYSHEEEGLSYSGMYAVLILGESTGTRYYNLVPDAHLKWISEPKGIDPGLLDEIDQVINEISPFSRNEL